MKIVGIRGGAVAAALAAILMCAATPAPAQQSGAAENAELAAKGTWDAATTYAKDDIITARGSAWISLRANNKNRVPGQTQPSTATFWRLFARGFNPTGAWSNVTKYQPDDLATFSGQTWRAKITQTNRQPTANQFWELFAAKGAAGPNTGIDAGTVSTPSISFNGDTGTGIFSPEAGKLALVENGVLFLHNKGNGNTALGAGAIRAANPGNGNTALGSSALSDATSVGSDNVAIGQYALQLNIGSSNTAVGRAALANNTNGTNSTAVGFAALGANTAGSNTAVGSQALTANTIGNENVAVGARALSTNTTQTGNTAVGFEALKLATASGNTAFGQRAMQAATTGSSNTAIGTGALLATTIGNANIAVGAGAAQGNTVGGNNVAIGISTLNANLTGSNNIAIGTTAGAGATAPDGSIFIGNFGEAADTALIRIGDAGMQNKAFIAGIRGTTTGVADAITVMIDSNGQLGTNSSSRRYKFDIETMGDVSAMLAKLRPVTFRYKQAQDGGAHPLQYGLIAEEVADVFPGLAVFKDGHPETVKYHLLPSFLLAGYQAQQKTIEAQADKIEALEERLRKLEAALPRVKEASMR
jgi:hypothetical protein